MFIKLLGKRKKIIYSSLGVLGAGGVAAGIAVPLSIEDKKHEDNVKVKFVMAHAKPQAKPQARPQAKPQEMPEFKQQGTPEEKPEMIKQFVPINEKSFLEPEVKWVEPAVKEFKTIYEIPTEETQYTLPAQSVYMTPQSGEDMIPNSNFEYAKVMIIAAEQDKLDKEAKIMALNEEIKNTPRNNPRYDEAIEEKHQLEVELGYYKN